jgi:hypothetical protein
MFKWFAEPLADISPRQRLGTRDGNVSSSRLQNVTASEGLGLDNGELEDLTTSYVDEALPYGSEILPRSASTESVATIDPALLGGLAIDEPATNKEDEPPRFYKNGKLHVGPPRRTKSSKGSEAGSDSLPSRSVTTEPVAAGLSRSQHQQKLHQRPDSDKGISLAPSPTPSSSILPEHRASSKSSNPASVLISRSVNSGGVGRVSTAKGRTPYCHQCRRATIREKMGCSSCVKVYCDHCITTRCVVASELLPLWHPLIGRP